MSKNHTYNVVELVLTLIWGVAMACCWERRIWYVVGLLWLHIGLMFLTAIENKVIALRMWASYTVHIVSGVHMMERAVLFIWVFATAVFVYDAYTQLTGESFVTLFHLPDFQDSRDDE